MKQTLVRLVNWLLNKKTMNRFATVALAFVLGAFTYTLAVMVYYLARDVNIIAGVGCAFGAGLGVILVWLYQNFRRGLRH
jgi:NhaP-type Na+/H+ or K+/H+ antiporter